MSLENRDAVEAEVRSFKQTIMAQDPVRLAPQLFPELFPVEEEIQVDIDEIPMGAPVRFESAVIADSEVDAYLQAMGMHR